MGRANSSWSLGPHCLPSLGQLRVLVYQLADVQSETSKIKHVSGRQVGGRECQMGTKTADSGDMSHPLLCSVGFHVDTTVYICLLGFCSCKACHTSGEVAQWVKHLPCKPVGMSSLMLQTHKTWDM